MTRIHLPRLARVLPPAVIVLLLCCPAAPAADQRPEEIAGKTLVILKDQQKVTVQHRGQVLARYRYAGVPKKPYLAELTAPGGVNVLRDAPADHLHHHGLMFAFNVEGVDFWSENDQCGSQVHQAWKDLRIVSVGGTERAVLIERLVWQTPEGDALLHEQRTLTVVAAADGRPRMLIWQADFTPGEDATAALTISGAKYHGLGMRFIQPMDAADGLHFNAAGGVKVAGTNGKQATWSAYTAPIAEGKKVTVAMFDAPSNPRHPCEWFTMGETPSFAYLSGTLGIGTEPIKLDLGKTLSVRFGVAVFDSAVDAKQVSDAYLRWYRLQAAARTGLAPGLIGRYFIGQPQGKPACVRIDPGVAFDFSGGMPDDRLPTGPFSASWQGLLRVDRDGEYRFFFRPGPAVRQRSA